MVLDIEDVQIFSAVVRAGSLSAAGRQLGISVAIVIQSLPLGAFVQSIAIAVSP